MMCPHYYFQGTAAQFDGFMDLTDVVRMRPELNWLDIFLGFRENVRFLYGTWILCSQFLYIHLRLTVCECEWYHKIIFFS